MNKPTEFDNFNAAMDAILRADPQRVKAEVEADIQAKTAERKGRGERKRGRKPRRSTSLGAARVSGGKD